MRPFDSYPCCLRVLCGIGGLLIAVSSTSVIAAEAVPEFERDVAPLLKKYCLGCHNNDDREGKFPLETYADLVQGGAKGPAFLAGDAAGSRMLRMLTGQLKPAMPPKDEPQPTAEEIAVLKNWVIGGAKGPAGAEPRPTHLVVPKLRPATQKDRITAAAWSPDGQIVGVGLTGSAKLLSAGKLTLIQEITDLPGKVTALEFSADGKALVIASGIPGLLGRATVWSVPEKKVVRTLEGHRDLLFAATLSRDGQWIATAGYDRQINLWNAQTGELVRSIKGHNDAVYDLAFHPNSEILASASGDQTIKLWQVKTGLRLDTLSQPLKEQYTVAFSPDGQHVVAGGADNRIRVWKLISLEKPEINPLLISRFAHEGAVTNLAFSTDGFKLVSVAEDRTIKLWSTTDYTELMLYERQPEQTPALAWDPSGKQFLVGRLDASLQTYPVTLGASAMENEAPTTPVLVPDRPSQNVAEQEPNSKTEQAQLIPAPAVVTGKILATAPGELTDSDLFAFEAQAGEQWVIEVLASRNKSALDSRIEILSAQGQPVQRLQLQAVRDSYVTFRGIDSNTRDCRLQNWEEMKLNEFVYLNGEVVKLFLAPRGPDSGFGFYPHDGNRRAYFDTTPTTHALNEPCYVVVPHPLGAKLVPNGLPVFPLYYENDDDGLRQWGADSRLNFTAPATGRYLIRITDARGFQGKNFSYQLTLRPARPGFKVTVQGANPTINVGSGKEFAAVAERLDGFDGEIRVDFENLPPGLGTFSPLVIQPGHDITRSTLNTLPTAKAPTPEESKAIRITAIAQVNGQEVKQEVGNFGEIKFAEAPKIIVHLTPPDYVMAPNTQPSSDPLPLPKPFELTIAPGQTITVKVRIDRKGYDGRVQFEAINQNLPHGVIIDNIGLNGLMIRDNEFERIFFITAADWVPETTRPFHLKSQEEGNQTSWPILLHVRKPAK